MNVDRAESRHGKQARRKDLPVSDDHHQVGANLDQSIHDRLVTDAFGLIDRKAKLDCGLLNRRGPRLHAAATPSIWLRYDQHDVVARFDQLTERRCGKAGGARKNNPEALCVGYPHLVPISGALRADEFRGLLFFLGFDLPQGVEARQAVGEQDSVNMVDLVLDGAGE